MLLALPFVFIEPQAIHESHQLLFLHFSFGPGKNKKILKISISISGREKTNVFKIHRNRGEKSLR